MSVPFSAENTLRVHDQALVNWLNTYLVDYGDLGGAVRNQVPCITVFASPHRAFASTVETLVSRGWISADSEAHKRALAEQNWPVLPLPVMTIDRDDPIISNELSLVPGSFRRSFFNDQTGLWEEYDFPGHYITQYRVTFWCEKRYTHAHFMEWLMANLGIKGAGSTEVMIPVQHAPPFGELLHALRYLGSGNLSDLEGFDARHIRSQLSFTLRSWFFRRTLPATYANGTPVFSTGLSSSVDGASTTGPMFPLDASWGTNNLFTMGMFGKGGPAFTWPGLFGNATAEPSALSDAPRTADLSVKVTAPTDAATLVQLPLNLNASGYAVVSAAASYQATSAATLSIEDADTPTQVVPSPSYIQTLTRPLPASSSWARFHTFAVTNKPYCAVRVEGAGSAATVSLSGTDIRQIYDQTRIVPNGWAVSGGNTAYNWTGLASRPYLVIATFSTSAAGTVTAESDSVELLPQHSRVIDDNTPGVAILVQPINGTLTLKVPTETVVSSVLVQPYGGPYLGDTA